MDLLTVLVALILVVLLVDLALHIWELWPAAATSSGASPHITGPAMVDNPLGVPAPASTTPPTQASSQLDQPVTGSGPAEPDSECVHRWVICYLPMAHWFYREPLDRWDSLTVRCMDCPASLLFERTLVPAAAPGPSTSVRPDSRPSAPAPAAAPSASSGPTEVLCNGGCTWSGAGNYYDPTCPAHQHLAGVAAGPEPCS